MKTIVQNLASFWDNPAIDAQKNPSDLLVLNKEQNKIETYQNKEKVPLDIEASNEVVKDFFVNQLNLLYGKEAIDFFYPEKVRWEALTVAYVKDLQVSINEFQKAVLKSCKSDLKQYDSAASAHLEVLKKADEAVVALEMNPTLKNEAETWMASLEKQTGISHQTALLLLGGGIALGAALNATSGGTLTFPMATLFHSSGALSMLTATHGTPLMGSSLAAAAVGAKTTTVGSVVTHIATPILEDAAIGAAVGGGLGAIYGLGQYNAMADTDPSIRAFRVAAVPFYTGLGVITGATLGIGGGITYHLVVNVANIEVPANLFTNYAHAAAVAAATA
ncbi:MAG: hypothetical protein ACOYK6_07225 [Chthoniobacterales bacterium]